MSGADAALSQKYTVFVCLVSLTSWPFLLCEQHIACSRVFASEGLQCLVCLLGMLESRHFNLGEHFTVCGYSYAEEKDVIKCLSAQVSFTISVDSQMSITISEVIECLLAQVSMTFCCLLVCLYDEKDFDS